MTISDINPFVRYARQHVRHYPRAAFSRCYDCRLFYFTAAEGALEIGDKKYNISNKTAVYLPPGSRYRLYIEPDVRYKALVLNFDLGREYSHITESLHTATDDDYDPAFMPVYTLPEELCAPIIRTCATGSGLISECVEEFITKTNYYRESASARVRAFLIELLREESAGGHSALVSSVIEYIKQHHADTGMTNTDIAARFSYHPYHLSRVMKAATGRTLNQYIVYYRLQMSRAYLTSTDLSIEMIAWKCGFSSAAYFIKCFRESVGTTPKKYRTEHNDIQI